MITRDERGFSLIELMAVLVLSSVVLVPLLLSFTNSIEINAEARMNRIAASVVEGALYTTDKIDFPSYRAALDDAISGGNDYLEMNADQCATQFTAPNDIDVCDSIFAFTSSNLSFDSATFKIFLFEYSMTTAEHNALLANTAIPIQVRDELESNSDILDALDSPDNPQLIWAIIWLDYYDNPDLYLVNTGIFANDDYTN